MADGAALYFFAKEAELLNEKGAAKAPPKEKAPKKPAAKGKAKGGRKPLWDEMYMADRLETVEGWARQGAKDKDIWEMLKISETLFYDWKKKKPEFAEALRAGAHESNGEILCSAFKQSTGYVARVVEPIKVRRETIDPATKKILTNEEVVMAEYDKYFEPDPRMTQFMLTNRLAEDYKAKQDVRLDREITVIMEGAGEATKEDLMG